MFKENSSIILSELDHYSDDTLRDYQVENKINISAVEGDPTSVVISYGPMPEGSDSLMKAGDTYKKLIGEFGPAVEDDPIYEYDFLGTTGYGFEVPTEDGLACNFICAEIGASDQQTGIGCNLFTILNTAASCNNTGVVKGMGVKRGNVIYYPPGRNLYCPKCMNDALIYKFENDFLKYK